MARSEEASQKNAGDENLEYFSKAVMKAASSLHSPGKPLTKYDLNDWISFILWLDKASVLLPLVAQGVISPYDAANSLAANKAAKHRKMQKHIVDKLCLFTERAKEESLRFVTLKGAPLALALYGSRWARHYTDIDVLIAADDIAKADYVARECCFTQPAEYFSLRDSGTLFNSKRPIWTQAPFTIRRRLDVDTLSEYVAMDGTNPIVLDVHDRIGGLDPRCMEPFLWNTKRIRFGEDEVNALSDAATIAHLVLTAFDDSEGYRPNSTTGMLGFKLYCDFLACLLIFRKADVVGGFALLENMGKEREASIVLSNFEDIFPGYADFIPHKRMPSHWGSSYRKRLIEIAVRKGTAAQKASELMAGPQGVYRLHRDGSGALCWDVPFALQVKCKATVKDEFIDVIWELPEALAADSEYFVFQIRLHLAGAKAKAAEVRMNLFHDEGSFKCYAKTSGRPSRSGKADKGHDGACCKISVTQHKAEGSVEVRAEISKVAVETDGILSSDLSIDGGIYKNHHGRIFHEIWRTHMTINGCPATLNPLDA